ncbi:MAG: hypothetical protein J5958_04100 [Clostridia bacterium]|nr:hypothetical protein [Clostridia bacterium]
MNNEKKIYETAEIKIVRLDNDMLLTSGGSLGENDWDNFDFSSLGN